MSGTSETFKAAWIASLKSKPTLLALLSTSGDIKETQWQGSDFIYPAVRVSVDFMPSVNRCGPDDADVEIKVYSEEKSSKQSVHIANVIYGLYHGHPFTAAGVMFNTVIVKKIDKPMRSIFAWETCVKIFCQGV